MFSRTVLPLVIVPFVADMGLSGYTTMKARMSMSVGKRPHIFAEHPLSSTFVQGALAYHIGARSKPMRMAYADWQST